MDARQVGSGGFAAGQGARAGCRACVPERNTAQIEPYPQGFEPDPRTVWESVFGAKMGGSKEGGDSLRGSKAVKFQYIAEYRGVLTRSHLSRLMRVSERGLPASTAPRRIASGATGCFSPISAAERSSASPTAITSSTSRRISCRTTLPQAGRTRRGRATSPTSGRGRVGFILLSSLICFRAASSIERSATASSRIWPCGR